MVQLEGKRRRNRAGQGSSAEAALMDRGNGNVPWSGRKEGGVGGTGT